MSLPGRGAAALAQRHPETGQSSNHVKSGEYWIARSRSWSRKIGSKRPGGLTVIDRLRAQVRAEAAP